MRKQRMLTKTAMVVIIGAACTGRDSAATAKSSALTLGEARVVSQAAPTVTHFVAMSPSGVRAYAWVQGADAGTLFVETDSAPAAPRVDPEGDAGLDPETPPKIAFGPKGELYVAYQILKKVKPDQEAWASLRVIRSDDNGRTWSAPSSIADDGLFGRYRNDHAFHVARDGSLYAAWIDLRDTTRTVIYSAYSSDRGSTWSRNTPIDLEEACGCCRLAMATAGDGRVFIAWRKVLPGGLRDIVVAHSSDHGTTWSKPVRAYADDWKIDGCPDAGPSLLADADGRLHLAWWTGKEGAAGVKYISSADGGATWGSPFALRVAAASRPSHVQLARAVNGAILATWDDGTRTTAQVVLSMSRDNGATFDPPVDVSPVGVPANFPVVATAGTSVLLAWHQPNTAQPETRQVVTRVGSLP